MTAFYKDKHVLITGGSSGIGLALAKIVAMQGANITILARRAEVLAEAAKEIKSVGNKPVHTLQADIANRNQITDVLSDYLSHFGTPDILINSAGNTYPGLFEDLSLDIFTDLMETNYLGTVNVIKTVLPGMIERNSGSICIVSSQVGLIALIGYSAYSPTKFALRSLADCLRYELSPYNISMSVAFPADTITPQLEFENKIKPAITRELVGSTTKTYSAEYVASAIARGIAAKKYIITPGFDATLIYQLSNTFGLVYPAMTYFLNQAWKKIRNAKNNHA